MNMKHILLAFTLTSVVTTGPIMAAVESNDKVELAESAFKIFKKDIRCVFSRKGCTREQKIRLAKQGLKLLGVVAILTVSYIAWNLSTETAYHRGSSEGYHRGYQKGQKEGATQAQPEKIRTALAQKQAKIKEKGTKVFEQYKAANKNVTQLVRLLDVLENHAKEVKGKQDAITQRDKVKSQLEAAQRERLQLEFELTTLLQIGF